VDELIAANKDLDQKGERGVALVSLPEPLLTAVETAILAVHKVVVLNQTLPLLRASVILCCSCI